MIGKKFVAILPILFESRQYKPGEELPTHNPEVMKTWIQNGAAKWYEKKEGSKEVEEAATSNEQENSEQTSEAAPEEVVKEPETAAEEAEMKEEIPTGRKATKTTLGRRKAK